MSLDSCEVHIELSLDASWNQSFEKALPDRFTKVSLNASTREQVLDDLVDSGGFPVLRRRESLRLESSL